MSVLDGGDSLISFLAVAAPWQRMIQSGSQSPSARGAYPTWWDALVEGPVDSPRTESETKGDRGVSSALRFVSMRGHTKRAGDVACEKVSDRHAKLVCQPDSIEAARAPLPSERRGVIVIVTEQWQQPRRPPPESLDVLVWSGRLPGGVAGRANVNGMSVER